MILVNNDQVNVFYLKSYRESKHKQLHNRNNKDNRQHGFVAEYLPELFLQYVEYDAHCVYGFRVSGLLFQVSGTEMESMIFCTYSLAFREGNSSFWQSVAKLMPL